MELVPIVQAGLVSKVQQNIFFVLLKRKSCWYGIDPRVNELWQNFYFMANYPFKNKRSIISFIQLAICWNGYKWTVNTVHFTQLYTPNILIFSINRQQTGWNTQQSSLLWKLIYTNLLELMINNLFKNEWVCTHGQHYVEMNRIPSKDLFQPTKII